MVTLNFDFSNEFELIGLLTLTVEVELWRRRPGQYPDALPSLYGVIRDPMRPSRVQTETL